MIRIKEARVPLTAFAILGILGYVVHPYALAPFAFLFIFTIYFFRDPERSAQFSDDEIICPADGRILEIVGEDDPFVGSCKRVAIFMSIMDVHVNRSPHSGKLVKMEHRSGKKVIAYLKGALEGRECNRMDMEAEFRFSIVQYAGILARRIVSFIEEGEDVEAGQRIGMIRYGSRVDVIMPEDFVINVKEGDRVVAGITKIAENNGSD